MLPSAAKVTSKLAPVLARLCASKNQVALTPFAIETWCAALSVFDTRIVNRAVLEIALGADPFPDLGKLVMRCQQLVWQQSEDVAPGRDTSMLPKSAIAKIASAMELDI